MNSHHLPHLDILNRYQFITYRTYDSVDEFFKKLQVQNLSNSKKQFAIDHYLDRSSKGAYLKGNILIELGNFFMDKNNTLYELISFCIMPNHVHLLIKPLDKLAVVMQKIKGASAKMINDMMGRKGRFWDTEYYDRVIRDDRHFWIVYEYIRNNPLKLYGSQNTIPRFYGIYESSNFRD